MMLFISSVQLMQTPNRQKLQTTADKFMSQPTQLQPPLVGDAFGVTAGAVAETLHPLDAAGDQAHSTHH